MNPEFQRNLYLEFSYARLIGTPLFLGFIFALTYLIDNKQWGSMTANTALWIYGFLVLFWGARQTTESIFEELRNHTWDIQKTSAISPWSLTWGKLFGSTVFNWYGGLLCLFVFAATSPKTEDVFPIVAYAVVSGLLAQSFSLLISLFALGKKQLLNSNFSYLFVLFLLFFVLAMMFNANDDSFKNMHWYDYEVNGLVFGLISLALACVWSIVGIYRLLAQELQIRTLPWVWVLFMGFLVFYLHGLMMSHEPNINISYTSYLMIADFIICSGLSYAMILIDTNNPMLMRRLWVYAEEENWQRFFEELPIWLLSLAFTLPACIYLTLFSIPESAEKLHFYSIPIFLLMLRDCGIILFCNYAKDAKRAFSLSVLYLTFLYGVIPAIFIAIEANPVAALFLPLYASNLGLAVIFAATQAAIVGYLLFNRWQQTINQLQTNL